ncbi:MAG: hypothetical protein AAB682_00505 [Patescibacteria group bacterium]
MKTTITAIVLSLIVGGGIGYYSGKGSDQNADQTKKLQDSIVMMKEQSSNIKTMAEMMKSNGLSLQESGSKYKDEGMMSMGKDMEMLGSRYMTEDVEATEKDASMKEGMK